MGALTHKNTRILPSQMQTLAQTARTQRTHKGLVEPYHILLARDHDHGRRAGAWNANAYGQPCHVRIGRDAHTALERAAQQSASLYILYGAGDHHISLLTRMRPGGQLLNSTLLNHR